LASAAEPVGGVVDVFKAELLEKSADDPDSWCGSPSTTQGCGIDKIKGHVSSLRTVRKQPITGADVSQLPEDARRRERELVKHA